MTLSRSLVPSQIQALAMCAVAAGVLVTFPYPDGCYALVLLAGMAIAWRSPATMLALLAVTIPVQAAGAFHVLGVSFTWTRAALLCLTIGWALASDRHPIKIDAIAWGFAAVLLFLGTSFVAGPSPGEWAGESYRWFAAFLVYVLARSILRSRDDVLRLILAIAIAVAGISVVGLYQVVTVTGPPSFVVDGLMRAYGTFGEPNPFAAYLELSELLLIGAWIAIRQRWLAVSRRYEMTVTLGAALGLLLLILTQSRGGWIGFGVGLLIFGLTLTLRQRWIAVGVAVGLALLILASPVGTRVTSRFATISLGSDTTVQVTPANWANEERRAHWGAAIAMIESNPWTGVGAGAFNDRFREYTPVWRFRIGRGHAHNGFLQLGAEAGVPGAAAFTFWVVALLITPVRQLKRTTDDVRRNPLVVAGVATVVAFTVHSLVDYLNVLSLGIELSIVMAVALAMNEIPALRGRPCTRELNHTEA